MQPLLYHAHHNQDLEDLPYWLGLAAQHGGPILELGCGTGRVTLPLIQAGYPVTGLDHSAEMLAAFKTLAAQAGIVDLPLVQADLTDFQLDQRFPLILLPCNTYSTLSESQRQAALECITRHLTPGGVFAASMPNPDWLASMEDLEEVEIETIFLHPETGNPVQASNQWRRVGSQLEICWHYDHLLPDGQVERDSQTTRHWLISASQFLEELENQGFQVAVCGDFEGGPYEAEAPYLIFNASKG